MTGGSSLFKVYLQGEGHDIVAHLPDELSVSLEQKYEDPAAISRNAVIESILSKFNITTQVKYDQRFVWMGSSPLSFSLPLVFLAENDLYTDVVLPVRNLMKIASPKVGYGGVVDVLRQPIRDEDKLSLRVGNLLEFSNVLITSIQPSLTRPLISDGGVEGIPSRVQVDVGIQAKDYITADDIDSHFFPQVNSL